MADDYDPSAIEAVYKNQANPIDDLLNQYNVGQPEVFSTRLPTFAGVAPNQLTENDGDREAASNAGLMSFFLSKLGFNAPYGPTGATRLGEVAVPTSIYDPSYKSLFSEIPTLFENVPTPYVPKFDSTITYTGTGTGTGGTGTGGTGTRGTGTRGTGGTGTNTQTETALTLSQLLDEYKNKFGHYPTDTGIDYLRQQLSAGKVTPQNLTGTTLLAAYPSSTNQDLAAAAKMAAQSAVKESGLPEAAFKSTTPTTDYKPQDFTNVNVPVSKAQNLSPGYVANLLSMRQNPAIYDALRMAAAKGIPGFDIYKRGGIVEK